MKGDYRMKIILIGLVCIVLLVSGCTSRDFCNEKEYDYVGESYFGSDMGYNGSIIQCCKKIINEDRTGFDEICEVFER